MFVKICGIRSIEDLKKVENLVDAAGVVVRSKSKRAVGLDEAKVIISRARIPVFVVSTESSYEGWKEIIERTKADYIQVHSDMDIEEFEKIKREFSCTITKAFTVPEQCKNPETVTDKIVEYASKFNADYFLFDTGKGSGKVHDLRVSREIFRKVDNAILAGGLNPVNVRGIIEFVKPFGVDVSSGVERNRVKDPELIRSFVEVVKSMNCLK